MSVIFPPAILGPEMAAPILWAPGIFVFSAGNPPMPIKLLVLGGGADFIFMAAGDFSDPRRIVPRNVMLQTPQHQHESQLFCSGAACPLRCCVGEQGS